VRAAPHCEQASAGAGMVAVAPPSGSVAAGDDGNSATAPMRMPHTSQKSSLAESWPDGQVAIAIPS
jgi:hypothetical protein